MTTYRKENMVTKKTIEIPGVGKKTLVKDVDLKVGDVVRLKSGGPSMTISSIVKDQVKCSWFMEPSQIPTDKVFNIQTLTKAPLFVRG